MSRRPALALALLGGALLAWGCAPARPKPSGLVRLELRAEPPSPAALPQGTVVKVAAVPVPEAELAWVSGTVKLFGAPVVAMKRDPKDGLFRLKTMVPFGVVVPPGRYDIKAWGRTIKGEAVEGSLSYEVK